MLKNGTKGNLTGSSSRLFIISKAADMPFPICETTIHNHHVPNASLFNLYAYLFDIIKQFDKFIFLSATLN